jgi:hypothetical protein
MMWLDQDSALASVSRIMIARLLCVMDGMVVLGIPGFSFLICDDRS